MILTLSAWLLGLSALQLQSYAKGPASPTSIGSSLRLLRQNDLNYTDASNHASTIVIEPKSFKDAITACGELNEGLLNLEAAPALPTDLEALLSYLEFNKEYPAGQEFWIGGKSAGQPRTLQLRNGKLAENDLLADAITETKLPALCSQSAPFRPAGSSDRSSTWWVNIESGSKTFTGFRDQLSFRFLGIPYANPPARWEYSTLFNDPHVTAINATNYGSECWQTGAGPFSEDCLFLNVFTSHLPTNGRSPDKSTLKPVMFWIHGGAFTSGTGGDPTFDGGSLVSRGDVVLVTINYRLSTLGFLSLNDGVVKGNYGLADQIVALEWVQQNIAAFGGDPDRITIFGQSAGAASVRALLASPKAIGKFAAAVPQSNLDGIDFASTYSKYFTPAQDLEVAGNQILNDVNCTHASDVVACLKAISPETLVNLPAVASFLVVDGEFLVSDQLQLDGTGPAAHVPTMWGHMRFDGAAFIGFPSPGEDVVNALQSIVGNQSEGAVASNLFPLPTGPNGTLDVFNVTARITTDVEFRCLDQATAIAAVKNNVFSSVYFYSFYRSYQTPGFDPNAPVCDAPKTPSHPFGDTSLPYFQCHSGELYYVFGNLGQFSLPFRDDTDLLMSQLSLDLWVAFASTFNPNPSQAYLSARNYQNTLAEVRRSGTWEPVNVQNPTLRRMDFPSSQNAFEEIEQCDFLGFPLSFYE
ncbi:cholinesterase [Ramaria rubella]|nr:cholinesterase [Ramaria rubella]